MNDFDNIGGGCLDDPRFHRYCVLVAAVIKKLKRPTIREMRLHMEDRFVREWHFDALGSLISTGEIKQVVFISPLRWETDDTPTRQVETKWNRSMQTVPRAVRPDNDQQYRAARA